MPLDASGNEHIADAQRAALDENGGERAAALVELGFDHRAFGGAVGIGLELEDLGLELDRLQQLVEVGLLGRRDFDVLDVAAHVLDNHLMLQQLLADLLRLGLGLVDLVDGDDHRDARRLGVVDRLDRLRLQPVIGGDHQDDDVGDVGAAGAHLGERLVAGSVEEGDLRLVGHGHLIGADVLRDSAGFVSDDVGTADGVEQRGLAVVDVAHDGHDRRTRLEAFRRVDVGGAVDVDVGFADALHAVAEFRDEELGSVLVDGLGERDRAAHLEQSFDQVGAPLGHAVGELLDGDRLGHDHVADLLDRRAGLHVVALFLLPGAAERGERAGAALVLVGEGAGDGQLAALAMLVAAAVRPRRLGPLGRRGMAGTAEATLLVFLDNGLRDFGLGRRLGGAAASSSARDAPSSAAASSACDSLRRGGARRRSARLAAVLAAARFLERSQARFLGFAQELLLKLLAARHLILGRRLARLRSAGAGFAAPAWALRRPAPWALRPAEFRPDGRGFAAS